MTWRAYLTTIIFFLGLISVIACSTEKKEETPVVDPSPNEVVLPQYSVLKEEITAVPAKAQIELNILVSGNITSDSLQQLLKQLFVKTKIKKGLKYHDSLTNIYIYLYTSKETAESGMGQWIAMLNWEVSLDKDSPKISIKEKLVSNLQVKPQIKFGLSEEKRKQIWVEIVKAEDRATVESEDKYPSPNQWENQIDLQRKLQDKYKQEVLSKYGLTEEILTKIRVEALNKNWAFPKLIVNN